MSKFSFNPNNYEPMDFDPIPAGEYEAVINSAEWKDTKAGTGRYLQLEFELTKEYESRRVWENLNLDNPNQKAVDIANSALSSICHALGIENLTDTDQLLNKPLFIKLSIQKDETYGDKNRVRKYTAKETTSSREVEDDDVPF